MPLWLHAIVSVAAPCAMGAVMFVAFDFWDRRRRRNGEKLPFIDYSI